MGWGQPAAERSQGQRNKQQSRNVAARCHCFIARDMLLGVGWRSGQGGRPPQCSLRKRARELGAAFWTEKMTRMEDWHAQRMGRDRTQAIREGLLNSDDDGVTQLEQEAAAALARKQAKARGVRHAKAHRQGALLRNNGFIELREKAVYVPSDTGGDLTAFFHRAGATVLDRGNAHLATIFVARDPVAPADLPLRWRVVLEGALVGQGRFFKSLGRVGASVCYLSAVATARRRVYVSRAWEQQHPALSVVLERAISSPASLWRRESNREAFLLLAQNPRHGKASLGLVTAEEKVQEAGGQNNGRAGSGLPESVVVVGPAAGRLPLDHLASSNLTSSSFLSHRAARTSATCGRSIRPTASWPRCGSLTTQPAPLASVADNRRPESLLACGCFDVS